MTRPDPTSPPAPTIPGLTIPGLTIPALTVPGLTRRAMLASAASVLVGSAAPAGPASVPTTLAARARSSGLVFGAALTDGALNGAMAPMTRFAAECDALTPEYAMKWAALHPGEDSYDFAAADGVLNWAASHKMQLRGHTLVWHESNPAWLEQTLAAEPNRAESLLRGHVATVVGRYKGRVAQWDVANEVVQPDDKQPGGLRRTLWSAALGPRYLDVAFQACAAADPGALRVLNEFGTDYTLPWQEAKRRALLALATDLVSRGVPIQAIGLQAHLDAAEVALDQNVLARFVADVAALGLKIVVTELDLRDDRLPAYIPARDAAVAAHARAWLDAVLPNPAVAGVLTWGLSGKSSWLDAHFPRPDNLDQRGLPLDAKLGRTPLYDVIAAALATAPPRPALTPVLATALGQPLRKPVAAKLR